MTTRCGVSRPLASVLLAVVLITGASAGAGAVTGTAAVASAGNTAGPPEAVSAVESGGDITVAFDTGVEDSVTGDSLTATDGEFVIYARQAGTDSFARVPVETDDVSVTGSDDSGEYRFQIDEDAHPLGDVSPASEVMVDVGAVRTAGTSGDEAVADVGNVTVDLSAATLSESSPAYTSRQAAKRVYEGTPIALQTESDDTPLLLRNVETGEILLDGATGENSRQLVFPSDALESGTTYRLIYNGDTSDEVSKYFNVTSLRLSAALEEDGRAFESGEDVALSVSGDAIRGNSGLAVEVLGPSDRYEQARLDRRGEFEATFDYGTDLDAGDYEVTVVDVQTGVSVSAGFFNVEGSTLDGPAGEYDADGDGTISDAELQAAIGDWATGGLDDSGLQAVILAWASG